MPNSISSSAQYVTLQKYFSYPSLVIYCLATPPIKLKLGEQVGGDLLIASNLDQSLWSTNQKHWPLVRSYLLHSCLQVRSVAVLFTSQRKLWNLLSERGMFWLFFIQFYYADHKLIVHSWRCLKVMKNCSTHCLHIDGASVQLDYTGDTWRSWRTPQHVVCTLVGPRTIGLYLTIVIKRQP
jgi:hypothetical protein